MRAYIKHVKKQAATQTAPSIPQTTKTDPTRAETHAENRTAWADKPAAGDLSNPLSDFFKKNNAYSELASPLGEKLKTSAWEHTHSAIRLAHQGEFSKAKLHADLANSAVHELGHYMSEADFIAFKRAVKAELLTKT